MDLHRGMKGVSQRLPKKIHKRQEKMESTWNKKKYHPKSENESAFSVETTWNSWNPIRNHDFQLLGPIFCSLIQYRFSLFFHDFWYFSVASTDFQVVLNQFPGGFQRDHDDLFHSHYEIICPLSDSPYWCFRTRHKLVTPATGWGVTSIMYEQERKSPFLPLTRV